MAIEDLGQPTSYAFSCQSCERQHSARSIQRHNAACKRCQGTTWTVDVTYVPDPQMGANLTRIAISVALSAAAQGLVTVGEVEKDEPHEFHFTDVPAQHMLEICQGNVATRLARYTVIRLEREAQAHRERLKSRGGECKHCGMVYVRHPSKEWTLKGYCSRTCAATGEGVERLDPMERGPVKRVAGEKRDTAKKQRRVIQVRCICGHQFDVPQMYEGTVRNCPQCGNKNSV